MHGSFFLTQYQYSILYFTPPGKCNQSLSSWPLCHFEKNHFVMLPSQGHDQNQFLPYILKRCRILKVEGHDGYVSLVRIISVVQLISGGEHGAISLLHGTATT